MKKAFTLAEVLITLGIIGVVAAITIPDLINANKAQKLRAQFLKTVSTLQQAFKLMEYDDISMDPNSYGRGVFCKNILRKYLTGATLCENSKSSPCYNINDGKPYKALSGKIIHTRYLDDGQVLLKDGTLLMCELAGTLETWISTDINGYNTPPNRWGYDLFTFQFVDGELRAMGDLKTQYQVAKDSLCDINNKKSDVNGITCAQKAKTDSDYFKKIVKIKFK